MVMRGKEKGNEHKKKYGPKCIREKDIKEKCNLIKSLCRDERKSSVYDISNVRCHGWDMGSEKE